MKAFVCKTCHKELFYINDRLGGFQSFPSVGDIYCTIQCCKNYPSQTCSNKEIQCSSCNKIIYVLQHDGDISLESIKYRYGITIHNERECNIYKIKQ